MSKQREWNLFERTGESAHDVQWELVRDEKGVCLTIPDSPMLPAVARWLAALPDWIDATELATALESVLLSSKEQQAAVVYEAVPRVYERQHLFVEAAEAIQPHGWEALESLIAALTEGQA